MNHAFHCSAYYRHHFCITRYIKQWPVQVWSFFNDKCNYYWGISQ